MPWNLLSIALVKQYKSLTFISLLLLTFPSQGVIVLIPF